MFTYEGFEVGSQVALVIPVAMVRATSSSPGVRFARTLGVAVVTPVVRRASELTITAPESVEAIDFVLGMHEDGTLMVPADTGAGWCGEAFGLGQAAMTMEGNWLYPAMENDFPDIPFEVAELPQGTQQGNLAFTVAYSIGADSANKEAAWVLLQYLTGPEGMAEWTGQGLALPSRDDVEPAPGREALSAGLEYATAYAFARDFPDIQAAFNAELTRVLAEGGTGQDVADAAAAAAQ